MEHAKTLVLFVPHPERIWLYCPLRFLTDFQIRKVNMDTAINEWDLIFIHGNPCTFWSRGQYI